MQMHQTLKIDGTALTYRVGGVLRVSLDADDIESTVVCIPQGGGDYRNDIIAELLKRLDSARYACEYALQDLVDEGNDDGEVAANLRHALSEIKCKHVT